MRKVFRISNILSVFLSILFGVLLFHTSQSVQRAEKELSRLEKAVAMEKETIRVLNVEWAYLNRPQRIERLAHMYLDSSSSLAGREGEEDSAGVNIILSVNDIPEPVVPAIPKVKPVFAGSREVASVSASVREVRKAGVGGSGNASTSAGVNNFKALAEFVIGEGGNTGGIDSSRKGDDGTIGLAFGSGVR